MDMSTSTTIRASVDTVFRYVTNVSNDIHWRTGVIEAGLRSDTKLEIGVVGYARGKNAETEWRLVAFTEGERMDWELISGPFRGTGGYRLEPVTNGTRFTLVADVEPSGVYRLLGPLFGWVGRRQNQQDVEKLREILESRLTGGISHRILE